jgi:uncharacterized DUF497 family protein
MKISFDPEKDRINRREHDGVSLSEVDAVFYDTFALTIEDRDHAEERFVSLGTDALGRL